MRKRRSLLRRHSELVTQRFLCVMSSASSTNFASIKDVDTFEFLPPLRLTKRGAINPFELGQTQRGKLGFACKCILKELDLVDST